MPHHESNVRICTTTSQCPSLPYPITLFNADSASAECSATTIGSQPDECRFFFWTIRPHRMTLTKQRATTAALFRQRRISPRLTQRKRPQATPFLPALRTPHSFRHIRKLGIPAAQSTEGLRLGRPLMTARGAFEDQRVLTELIAEF